MTCIQVLLPYFLDYVKSAGDRWYNSWKKWICTLRRLCRALQLTVMGHTGQWRVEVLLRSLIFSCPIFFFVWANLFFFLKANEIHIKELSSLLKKKKIFFFFNLLIFATSLHSTHQSVHGVLGRIPWCQMTIFENH